jgi:DnaK suppressor protein
MPGPPTPQELTSEQRDDLRRKLEGARKDLQAQLDAARDASRPVDLDEPIGRLTRMDAIQQQKMAQAGLRDLEARLERIAAALAAMTAGEYGFCGGCEEPIGHRRLRARPESRLCVRCQDRLETRR